MTRQMKDSGVEWLGEIPFNWNTIRLKFLSKISTGNGDTKDKVIDGKYPFFVRSQTVEYLNDYTHDEEAILTAGDGAGVGKVFHHYIGKFSAHQRVYIFNGFSKNIFPRFLFYYIQSNLNKVVNLGEAKSTVDSIRLPMLTEFPVVLPCLEEQIQISNKLDKIIDIIDSAILETQQSIEELKKYKQSLITEVVTKGLDENIEMKDSGVEWIGKIPLDWEVINSKRLFGERKEKAYVNDIQLTASQKYGILPQEEFMKIENQRVTVVEFNRAILKHVEPGDFVISMRSFQGGLEYSNVRGCISSAYVMLYPKMKIHTGYFKWLFKSLGYISALQSTSNLIRDGQALRYTNFSKVPLLNVPYSQQGEISDFLDQKVDSIDKLIDEKELLISEFEQYKKSLIYEYVTGKKQV
ncbi:restriction endonuclease subunit S [Lysinibacillus xylanilyticus]|uniref:restriction endonuclease subunit S n=1 Tax=Lysinibacillus xylanilyticus TaxID=582475 RepID=UPI0038256765